jgi:myo-inosose-2 dehydratase
MTIRIGANPICWSNDDLPEIGGWISLEQCLTQAKEFGIEGMELGNKFPRDPKVLGPILKSHGLDLVSGWYSTFLLERDADAEFKASETHRHLLKALGAKVLIAAECTRTVHGRRAVPLSKRPVMTKAEADLFNGRLTRFAEMLLADGLRLVYHHHMGTVVQTAEEIDRVMQGTGEAVHLLLDTGHATWGGDDPVRLAETYKSRISHVHCKDVRMDVKAQSDTHDWSFLDAVLKGVYTVPGDGKVDYVSVFKALSGYSGWVVLEAEQDTAIAPPEKYVPMGITHMKRFLKEAGLS